MHVKTANFVTSATKPAECPESDLPEIAFAGRSNVGKSSLINCLVNRKKLVKTSNTPGRTQLLNFFNLNDAMMLVDLPGYGYAKVPAKVRAQWRSMIESYLLCRRVLKGVVLILDARRDGPNPQEVDFLKWLQKHRLPVLPVLTKCDKLKKNALIGQRQKNAEALGLEPPMLIIFSAKTRRGRDEVWEAIDALVEEEIDA